MAQLLEITTALDNALERSLRQRVARKRRGSHQAIIRGAAGRSSCDLTAHEATLRRGTRGTAEAPQARSGGGATRLVTRQYENSVGSATPKVRTVNVDPVT